MKRYVIASSLGAFGVCAGFACASFDDASPPVSAEAGADDAAVVVVDGGADVGADIAAPGFCASAGTNVYCRDFDTDAGATEQWNSVSVTAGQSALTLDPSEKISPPFALLARIEPNADLCTYAAAQRDLGALPAKTTVSFDVKIGGADTRAADGSTYFVIYFDDACAVIFSASESNGRAQAQFDGGDNYYPMVTSYPRYGTWAHFEARIDREASRLEIFVDGVSSLDNGAVTLPAGCFGPESHVAIRPGMHCEYPSDAGREVRIDNILVTIPQ